MGLMVIIPNELLDVACIRRLAGIAPVTGHIPDATTILACRHFLEQHQLGEKIVAAVREQLREQGLMPGEGTVVDATIIHAPPSTRNRKREREPDMPSSRKGNQWFFGMKAQIGVDQDSVLIHGVSTSGATVQEVTMAAGLLPGEESVVYGDGGYRGLEKRWQDGRWSVVSP